MMVKESVSMTSAGGLEALGAVATSFRTAGPPPVHLWNPPFCGDIDMRIARDGTWFHAGTPIGRPALVRLFSSILRRDAEGVMLVTPVEKVRIVVDDAPFLAVEMTVEPEPSRALLFRTNVDDRVRAGADHPLRFEPAAAGGLKPYVLVRPGLEALVTRSVFLELVERGETRIVDGVATFGIASGAAFFPMAPTSDLLDPA